MRLPGIPQWWKRGYTWAAPTCYRGVVSCSLGNGTFVGLAAATGDVVWATYIGPNASSFFVEPTGVDGSLYFAGGDGNVYVLNAVTGALLAKVAAATNTNVAFGAFAGGALVTNTSMLSPEGPVIAISPQGTILWTTSEASFLTAAIAGDVWANSTIIAGAASGLYSIDAASGETTLLLKTKMPLATRPAPDPFRAGVVYLVESASLAAVCIFAACE